MPCFGYDKKLIVVKNSGLFKKETKKRGVSNLKETRDNLEKYLKENAEDYGFILRYRKDKEEITKVNYEPWHWRYVGEEHAKKINELDMCLEEYIEYLKIR